MICSQCKSLNSEPGLYCQECGSKFPEVTEKVSNLITKFCNKGIYNHKSPAIAKNFGKMAEAVAVGPLIKCIYDMNDMITELNSRKFTTMHWTFVHKDIVEKYGAVEPEELKSNAELALLNFDETQGFKAIFEVGSGEAKMAAAIILSGLPKPHAGKENKAYTLNEGTITDRALIDAMINTLHDKENHVIGLKKGLFGLMPDNYMSSARGITALALGCTKGGPLVTKALRQALDYEETVKIALYTGYEIPGLGYSDSYAIGEFAAISLARLGDKESINKIVKNVLTKWWLSPDKHQLQKENLIEFMYSNGWDAVIYEISKIRNEIMSDANFTKDTEENLRLRESDFKLKEIACLAAIRNYEAIKMIIDFAQKDEDIEVCTAALSALGDVGDKTVLEVLIRKSQDKNRLVRNTAKKAIKSIKKRNRE